MISVIVPVYNEEKLISTTAKTIAVILKEADIDFELLFVDDGSKDESWKEIRNLAGEDPHTVGVHLSRNFGKEAAMFAGLEKAKGDCAVILDSDLQHPPEKIVEMYRLWEQGAEVVEGVKEDRGKESAAHSFGASVFYRMISKATGQNMTNASDFKLLDRKVIDVLNALPEKQVFFRALSYWVGFQRAEVLYKANPRKEGESKWTTSQLIKYAIRNVSSFTSLPLHIITWLGVLMLLIGIVFGITALVQKVLGLAVPGFTTVILLILIASSLIMISLGIIGYYIGRIFEEMKGRPRYIISETFDGLQQEENAQTK